MNAARSSLARAAAELPATFWWLWAGLFVSALATFVITFLTLFLTERGFSVEQAGLTVATFGGGSIVSGPVAGWLADRFGRRPTLILSLVATAALTALVVVLSSLPAIAAAVLALGIASNAYRPAMSATIVDLVPAPYRERAFGLVYWAHNLGMSLSAMVGGAIAAYGYGRLFLADALTTLVCAAFIWGKVPESRPAAASDRQAEGEQRGYATVLADRAFLAFLIVNLAFIVVLFQFQVVMPLDMQTHGLGPQVFGPVLAVNGILIAVLQPFSGRLTARFSSAHVLAAASLLLGMGYGSYAWCTRPMHYALGTAVWSLGEILALPVASALVADLSPPDLRGRYQGVFSLSWGFAMLIAPIAGSAVLGRLGSTAVWRGCLALGIVAAAGHLAIAGLRRGHRVQG